MTTEEKDQQAPQTTDWEALAWECFRKIEFMASQFQMRGPGTVGGIRSGKIQTWRDYLADTLVKFPGVTVDREELNALSLPYKKRQEWFKKNRPKTST